MRREWVDRIVDAAAKRPASTVGMALVLCALLLGVASRLELRSDLLELLPRDSPGLQALEHQLGRVGGRSTLLVMVSSPDRARNERFVDDLARTLRRARDHREPWAELVAYVESDARPVRDFYQQNQWLYADLEELERADRDLDRQIAVRGGWVEDLDDGDPGSTPQPALGLQDDVEHWEHRAASLAAFRSDWFETPDGSAAGLRIVADAPLGDARGDRLFAAVREQVARLGAPEAYGAAARVGYAGEIAAAAQEKRALASEAVGATAAAVVIIALALIVHYRSAWCLPIIGLPALLGVAAAYAFAECAFGYVNACGAFLGAIIVGNGINYPIVLLSRYREFLARGMAAASARREAVQSALRAELVGASVAAVAYGSLAFTRFRGFRQFGAVGFVGMFCVWAAIVPLVPAMLVVVERVERRLPESWAWPPARAGSAGAMARLGLAVTGRAGAAVLALVAAVTAVACLPVPRYLADPWEYDFGKLGSAHDDRDGSGEWQDRANLVFGGKSDVAGALMLADTPEQAPLVKRAILANDARDPRGPMISRVVTVDDLLPGSFAEQEEKLAVIDRIRGRLSAGVLSRLSANERARVDRARPPPGLRPIAASDLPALLRRRFGENDGRIGTVLYVQPREDIVFADGHNHLRLSRTTDRVRLPDGSTVLTASRSTVFAEMLTSMRRDGPRASLVAFAGVTAVVLLAARDLRLSAAVLVALATAALWLVGFAAWIGVRIHYVNFIAVPITLGIGSEYPFNLADRTRLLGGDAAAAVARSGGAVLLCSFTTVVGYGSLLASDVQALRSFGELAVSGELASAFVAVVALPAALARLRIRRSGSLGSDGA
jgi:predicted RND superfamily exporter protein